MQPCLLTTRRNLLCSLLVQVLATVNSTPLPLLSSSATPLMPQLLYNHLMHHRYWRTANAIQKELLLVCYLWPACACVRGVCVRGVCVCVLCVCVCVLCVCVCKRHTAVSPLQLITSPNESPKGGTLSAML